jgi:hypothetical protein
MPRELKERVQTAAVKNNRSMNAEIVAVLQRHYPEGVETEGNDIQPGTWSPGTRIVQNNKSIDEHINDTMKNPLEDIRENIQKVLAILDEQNSDKSETDT